MSKTPICSPEEWQLYCTLVEIKGIASRGFARRVNLAHELGLLTLLLSDDWEAVRRRASECEAFLAAQIHSWCQVPEELRHTLKSVPPAVPKGEPCSLEG